MIPFIPESHLHHARKGNDTKAKASMIRLYGTAPDYDVVSFITPKWQHHVLTFAGTRVQGYSAWY